MKVIFLWVLKVGNNLLKPVVMVGGGRRVGPGGARRGRGSRVAQRYVRQRLLGWNVNSLF